MPPGLRLAQAACASGPTVSLTFLTGRPISSCSRAATLSNRNGASVGGVAGGTAQVADQNQAAAAVEDRGQGWQRALDPAVVGNAAVGRLRDVEIDADQDLFAGHVDVAESLFGHGQFPGDLHVDLNPAVGALPCVPRVGHLWSSPVLERTQLGHQLGGPVGITPLVVVPGDDLDEVAADRQGLLGDEDAANAGCR